LSAKKRPISQIILKIPNIQDFDYHFKKDLILNYFRFVIFLIFISTLLSAGTESEIVRAQISYTASNLVEAETIFAGVVEEAPEHVIAWNWFGAVKMALGKYDEAFQCYSNSAELSPNLPAFFGMYRASLAEEKNYQASKSLGDALSYFPKDASLRYLLALPPSVPYLSLTPSVAYASSSTGTSAIIYALDAQFAWNDFFFTRMQYQQTLASTDAFKKITYDIKSLLFEVTGLFDLKNSLSFDGQIILGNDTYSSNALAFKMAYNYSDTFSFGTSFAVMPFPQSTAAQLNVNAGFTLFKYFLLQASTYGEILSYSGYNKPEVLAAIDPALSFNYYPFTLGVGSRFGTLFTPFLNSGLISTTLMLKTGLYTWVNLFISSQVSLSASYSFDTWGGYVSTSSDSSTTSQFKIIFNVRIP
jgi:tetratricopeptide (TPR) repeat protein